MQTLAAELVEGFRLGDIVRVGGALRKLIDLARSADWAAINDFLRELLGYLPTPQAAGQAAVQVGAQAIGDLVQTIMLLLELFRRARDLFA